MKILQHKFWSAGPFFQKFWSPSENFGPFNLMVKNKYGQHSIPKFDDPCSNIVICNINHLAGLMHVWSILIVLHDPIETSRASCDS